jgi:hypothetical protein
LKQQKSTKLGEKKMLTTKSKRQKTKAQTAFLAISLIAMFATSMLAPLTLASTGITYPRKTYGYIDVAPTVIGVGQKATVTLFIEPIAADYALATVYPIGYSGITVTFIKPDGSKDTFAPTDANGVYPAGVVDALGTMFFFYAADKAGNWSVTMTMPAQNFTDQSGTATYTGCTSEPAYFTVTTEPQYAGLLNGYPWAALPNPNTYWTYPVSSNNREWSKIAGDWLGGSWWDSTIYDWDGLWQPYGSAPSTAHILWKMPYGQAGLVGGSYGSLSYTNSAADWAANDIIINGKLYISHPDYSGGFDCIDLATGKTLWTAAGSIVCGIHLPGSAYSQAADLYTGNPTGVVLAASAGVNSYLFGTDYSTGNWNYYNPNTGTVALSFSNVNVSITNGPYLVEGTPLAFGTCRSGWNYTTLMYDTNYVWCWNMSKVVPYSGDWSTGLQWIKTVNNPATGQMGPGDGTNRASIAISADLSSVALISIGGNLVAGFDANTGKSIWNMTTPYTNVCSDTLPCLQLFGTNNFLLFDPALSEFHCYSALTGKQLWSTIVGDYPWNTKGDLYKVNDNDNVYLGGPDGTITALSLTDGHKIWKTTPIQSTEYVSNALPYWTGMLEADGKLYAWAGPIPAYVPNPISRLSILLCFNATTGETVFTLNGGSGPSAAVAGYLTTISFYDGRYYCLGKGQTSTSVLIQNDVVANGATVLIKGNVLDQSPAQTGTPAVADSAMSEWMDYIHMQNATLLNNPPKEPGVPVTLTALDPNNNTIPIGITTTDSAGNYAISFVPTVTGMYTITATFAGTNSYWKSSSETKLTVISAATTSAPTSTGSVGISETTLYASIAAVIVAIAIVGVVLGLLMLRKRP